MNQYVKQYLTFFAFIAVTKIVVAPVIRSLKVPMLTSIVD